MIPHSAGGDSVLVIVKDKPSAELGSNKNICEGDSVVLDAGVASTYQWNKGEITKNITVKTTGDYSVEITASNGCKAADTINVKVNTKPNVVLNNAVICEGDAAVTFLVVLPLTHVIEVFLATTGLAEAFGVAVGVGVGTTAAWVSFTLSVGEENVNP